MSAGTTTSPLQFACKCGQVTGHLSAKAVQSGTRVVCFCKDCRAASIHLGHPDPAPEPVDVFQTSPEGVSFDTGQDLMGLFRFSPGGLMRWYATCCNTAMFNTVPNPKIPFVSVLGRIVDDPDRLGKVRATGFVAQPDGSTKHKNSGVMVWGIATRALASRLSGSWKATPFYDVETGKPVITPTVLTKDQRAAATP